MQKVISALVAAVVMFFVGFLWWGLLMPIVKPPKVIADAALVEKMGTSLSESGLYFYPDYSEPIEEADSPQAFL